MELEQLTLFAEDIPASHCNDGKDAFRGAMAELLQAGWVERSGGRQGAGGVFQAYQYELMLDRGGKTAAAEPPRSNRSGNNTEDNKTEKQTVRVSRFDEFWESYPNKVGRKVCEHEWKSRNLDGQLTEILAGLARWKAGDRWARGFIKDPLTFLNQEIWRDAPPLEIKPMVKGEVKVREMTPEQSAQAKADALAFQEFCRLKGLPENNRKSEAESWKLVT